MSESSKRRHFKMPSSFTVLYILIVLLAILTWIIPAGQYQVNDAGQYIAGTYEVVNSNAQGLYDILMAPIHGLIGNDLTDGAIQVAFFILMVGGFLGVVNKTGALDQGIASVIKKNKGNERILIPI